MHIQEGLITTNHEQSQMARNWWEVSHVQIATRFCAAKFEDLWTAAGIRKLS